LKKIFYILLTTVFILTGYYSIDRLITKPDLPFEFYPNKSGVYFNDYSAMPGEYKINSIDSFIINNEFQLEFFLDRKQIGDNVNLYCINDSGETVNNNIKLTAYYHDSAFIFVTGFVGYVFLLMALFVVLKKPEGKQSVFLYWTLTLFATATLTSPGQCGINGDFTGYIIRTLHALSYSAGGLFAVLFILSFPVEKLKKRKANIIVLSVLTLSVALFASVAQINSISNINNVVIFDTSWVFVLGLLIISLVYGTFEFAKTLKSLTQREDKRKIEWILWGLTVGVSPYIIFWVIPRIFKLTVIINEEFSLAFLIFIPISFVIAVIKYQAMDIELVVKRSFVYSLLSLSIIGIYSAFIYISSKLFNIILGSELEFYNLFAVLISALLFNPIRNRLNKFADRVFYREKYVIDKALNNIISKIKECITPGSLGKLLIIEIEKLLPVSSIAVVIRKSGEDRLRVLEQKNFDELSKNILALRVKQLTSDFKLPLALEKKVEKGISIDTSMEQVFKRWGINIALPLMPESNEVTGAIVLGDKLSGLRYSKSDIDLLITIASSAALASNRFELQEKLALEELEISKLEELNRLKSFYVASVSHDLKTPLTSIKVFTELMQSGNKITDTKRNEYLKIIEGETDRLSRLIDNVLDYAKIEKGIKQYSFTRLDLNKTLKCVLNTIEYTLQINKFNLYVKYAPDHIMINGDQDAIKSVLFNIINNSVKYSSVNKLINIVSALQNNSAIIEIEDQGIGIPESDQKFIFDPFFRSVSNEIKGAGLGLAIVRHIMDAHNGKIELQSKINTGTKFRLIFPLSENE